MFTEFQLTLICHGQLTQINNKPVFTSEFMFLVESNAILLYQTESRFQCVIFLIL